MQRTPENGNVLNGEPRPASVRRLLVCLLSFSGMKNKLLQLYHLRTVVFQDMALAIPNAREPESEEKPQKSLNEKQQVSTISLRNCFVSWHLVFHSLSNSFLSI